MADPNDKKEFTSILDLQKIQAENPEVMAEIPVDPFAVNELASIEQVDHFDSIDQIGMMDHPEPTTVEQTSHTTPSFEAAAPEPTIVEEDPFAVNVDEPAIVTEDPFAVSLDQPTPVVEDPFAVIESETINKLKNYSEQTQGKTSLEVKTHYPFHLKITGVLGPYERDKLLLFISENPIGLSSGDLDLQIQAGKVFFPRISEFAAVKLVQELRDSGLSFSLHPSDREGNETVQTATPLSFHYEAQNTSKPSTLIDIPILNANAVPQKPFQEIDEVSVIQFVRTEMMEVENSPMIQEVIERMTEALKQKARLKGGNALLSLQQEILPLRLPSQYQISLKASVIKI